MKNIRLLSASHQKYNPDFFIISSTNRAAYEWIQKWPFPQEENFFTFLEGAEKSGKKHLAHIWLYKNQGVFLPTINCDALSQKASFFVCEIKKDLCEESLFHFFNAAKQNKKYVLFVSCFSVNDLNILLPDLRSRLYTANHINIGEPDEMMMKALYKKLFYDFGVQVFDDVVHYLILRQERSYKSVYETVVLLEEESLNKQHAITIPFVKKVLFLNNA